MNENRNNYRNVSEEGSRFGDILFYFSAIYIALHAIAIVIVPEYLVWGVNQGKYLSTISIIVLTGAMALLVAYRRNGFSSYLKHLTNPKLAAIGIVLVIGVYALNIEAHILGDGANIIHNTLVSLKGESVTSRAPLTFFLVKQVYVLLDSVLPANPGDGVLYDSGNFIRTARELHVAYQTFTVLGIVCLVILLYTSYRFAKMMSLSTGNSLIVSGFIAMSGFLAEFAGYVELYFLSIIALLLFFVLCIRAIHLKKGLWALPIVFAVAVGAHIGNIIYAPIAIAAMLIAEDRWHRKAAFALVGVAAFYFLMFVSGISIHDFVDMMLMKHSEAGTHLIPFAEASKSTQSYSAFSIYHFLDLTNLLFIVQPFPYLIIVYVMIKTKCGHFTKLEWLLIVSAALSFGMMFIFNCDIGMVADWDLLTPYFVAPLVAAVWLMRRSELGKNAISFAGTAVIAIGAHTLLWMLVLSNSSASIERMMSLQNPTTFSKDGLLVTTTRIAQYDLPRGNTERAIGAYERLINTLSPDDPRGYFTLSGLLERMNRKEKANQILALAYNRGISDYRIDFNYAGTLSDQGAYAESNKALSRALAKIPVADSSMKAKVFASLALNYIIMDSIPNARASFQRAFDADYSSEYALVYYSQFLLVVDKDRKGAKEVAERALASTTDRQIRKRAELILKEISSTQ